MAHGPRDHMDFTLPGSDNHWLKCHTMEKKKNWSDPELSKVVLTVTNVNPGSLDGSMGDLWGLEGQTTLMAPSSPGDTLGHAPVIRSQLMDKEDPWGYLCFHISLDQTDPVGHSVQSLIGAIFLWLLLQGHYRLGLDRRSPWITGGWRREDGSTDGRDRC